MTNKSIGLITEFFIGGSKISVYLSNHAEKRLRKRIKKNETLKIEVNEYVIASNVLALGKHILYYCDYNKDVAIIDEDMGLSVIAEFNKVSESEGKVNIITLIDKCDIYVKEGTHIQRLS